MRVITIGRLLLVSAVTLSACKKGDPKPTLELDEPTVAARLEGVGADVPGCDVTGGASASRVAAAARGLTAALRALPAAGVLPAGSGSTGTCGGGATVDFYHENGTNYYTMHLADLCTTSADGNVTLNGTINSREIGKPSDNGPVIEAMEVETVGAVQVSQNGNTGDVVVTGFRAEYGKPAAWAPEPPDEANPDVVNLDNVTITFSSDGRTEYVEGLRYERTGDATTSILTVTHGVLGREGEAFVTMSTVEGDPIVIDMMGLQVQSGTLRLAGAKDTELLITPGASPGVIDFDLNGSPFPSGLDCSAGRQPLVEVGMALILALPVR